MPSFRTFVFLSLATPFLFALSSESPTEEMGSGSGNRYASSGKLDIDLGKTASNRKTFRDAYNGARSTAERRTLFEQYINKVGANGLLYEIESADPKCHVQGHPLGMVIYARLGKIGPALQACRDGCNSGCMHGVFMEAFIPGHLHEHGMDHKESRPDVLASLRKGIPTACSPENLQGMYKIGDCAHGVGHAVMHILDYDIPKSMEQCRLLETYPMEYYCATGAYMQYVNARDPLESKDKPILFPCDTGEYPAACFRYKMTHVMRRNYLAGTDTGELARLCLALDGKYRMGCFHGIGNAHVGYLALGKKKFLEVCGFGSKEDQYVCIDGAVERLAKFHPQVVDARCKELDGWRRQVCQEGAKRGMYDLDKSFKYYVQ